MATLVQYANGVPGVKFSLDKSEITIGRGLDNDISIDDEFVSKRHAVIRVIEDELTSDIHCLLIDSNSTNYTFVNNRKVNIHRLDEKDKIFIGQNEFCFSLESVSPLELGRNQSGYYDDDSPGLMHERLQKAALTTTRITEQNPDIIPDSPPGNISFDDLSTNTLTGYADNSIASTTESEESLDKNKRFSRRLTLI